MPATQFLQFNQYQRVTADDLNLLQNTFTVYKFVPESVTSSTTLQPDNDLHIPQRFLVSPATYYLQAMIYYTGGTQGQSDIKVQLNTSTGATFNGVASYNTTAGAQECANKWQANTPQWAGTSTGDRGIVWQGSLAFIVDPVTKLAPPVDFPVWLSWAQNTSNATATTVLAGSSLMLTRLS